MKNNLSISFVIPVMDEEETIRELYLRIEKALAKRSIKNFEVIFIDDGSRDGSWNEMNKLKVDFPEHVKAIKFRKNFGKALALNTGFEWATGDLVFTMDADLQDDPDEISNFLDKLDEGYDLVSGWKQNRQDPISKTLPSKLFNKVTAKISGVNLHDFNCGFKLYRKEVIKHVDVYGELHRYIPVLANDFGFKIAEIPVKHHERKHGVSKYGWERYARGLLDLLTIVVTTKYLQKPNHLFGGLGMLFGFLGTVSLGYLIIIWFMGEAIGNRPLLMFGVLSIMLSVQMLSLGLLSELINKNNKNTRANEQIIEETLS